MKRLFAGLVFVLLLQALTFAQSTSDRRGWGYVFVAPGAIVNGDNSGTLHVGGGGEGLVSGGFGLGGEIGYFGRLRDFDDGFGLASVNASYHFRRTEKLVPFVTGGGSLGFRSRGSSGGGNFGVGAQYWMRERMAVRFEFRNHIFSSDSPYLVSFRIGLAFR